MKKYIKIILTLTFCFFILVGCEKNETKPVQKEETNKENQVLTKTEIISKLNEVDSAMVELWNEVFCEVSWYTGYGTSSTGNVLDIEFVVFNAKGYYDKLISYKDFINNLDDDYANIKNAYNKAIEKAEIIYNEIMKEIPQANTKITYKDDITLYDQYMDYFSDAVYELD